MTEVHEFDRLCKRFEIAVENFGRSCFALQAREASFQAWYAACVIQEFGLSRVYREIHLPKKDLFASLRRDGLSDEFRLQPGKTKGALSPDLAVSRIPDIDARTAYTRDPELRPCRSMLRQLAIVTEFKVTASAKYPNLQRKSVLADFGKLLALLRCHAPPKKPGPPRPLAAYMVILDNHRSENGHVPIYSPELFKPHLSNLTDRWPDSVPRPTVLVLTSRDGGILMDTYRDFSRSA